MPQAQEGQQTDDQKLWDQLERDDGAQATAAAEATQPNANATEQAPSKTNQGTATAQTGDDFEGFPPAARDIIAGQTATIAALERRFKSLEGNLGGLKSQVEAARAASAAVRQDGGAAPTAAAIAAAGASTEKWNKLKAEYSDWAEAFDERIAAVVGQVPRAPAIDVDKLMAATDGRTAGVVLREIAKLKIELRHEGWEETTQSPQFKGFVNRQPPEVQKLYVSDNPRDVIRLLDLYEEGRKGAARTQTTLTAAAAVAGKPGAATRTGLRTEGELDGAALWDALDQQDQREASAYGPGRR